MKTIISPDAPTTAQAFADYFAEKVSQKETYHIALSGGSTPKILFELLADEQQQTQVLLRNASATEGISLHYNTEQLPCFAQWKHTGALQDGYVTGLEPATNFPNPRSFEAEHQRVVSLAPDESRRFDLKLQFHDSAAEVEQAELAVKKLSGEVEPSVASLPEPAWSFGAET